MKLLQSMPMRQRLVLGGSILGVLIVAFFLFSLASKPSYSLVASGLDPAKTGKMTAALDEQGVTYEIRNNGTALAVEKSQTAQAQIALSSAGLSGSTATQPGFELLDKQKLGASSFQQKVAYQRALEGQIAQTIGQVNGVTGAQVQLTLPEDQLFADEAKPATAAVLLSGDSSTMESGAVKGIANLVASSVEGLKTDNVTIADGSGQMLWPAGEDGAAGSMSKAAAEARYASQLESSLNAMLVRTLGPDKAQVRVNADLNVDDTSIEKLQYDRRGTPLKETSETEQLKGQGGAGGAAAGTTANVPGYGQRNGGSGGGKSDYQNDKETTDFAVGKTVTRTQVAPGAVQRQDVALMVDKSVPAADVAALRRAVQGAAGIQAARGDTLQVSQIAFAKPPAPAKSLVPTDGILGYAKYALLGIASLVFLFFITRHLRRREDEVFANPTWLRQLDAPTPIAQLENAAAPSLIAGSNPRRAQVEEVVQREPERVANALRAWMNEDK
jgi:flagellar M-ring protein FliF